MARPKIKEPKQQFTVMLKPSIVKEIDRLAEKADLSRSQFMANLIEMGLDDAKMLDKLGFISAIKSGRKVIEQLKKSFMGHSETD